MEPVTPFMWSLLAELGPINPQTMRKYHPSTLEKVWTGKRKNAFLSMWLDQKLEDYAKANKETSNARRKKRRRNSSQSIDARIDEISELTEAIRGEANSN